MNLFVDYIQPLTEWLQANPHWSLFITFIISLTESLAIIGSIVPGSITMTAIGILAGSGIMRIDLTLLAAILGAITGDGLSYALGYVYSEQLADMWPFKKYPNWLKYGKEFFERHGGKSVFLGRFVGPLRSITPVIAGIMHMKQWRFFVANSLSAVGWSILYVMPGVLIGAASHELSAESATRLFLLLFIVLVGIWLASILIKWLLIKINAYLKRNLHQFWLSLKHHPILYRFFNFITPANEENHYPTIVLLIMTVISLLGLSVLILFTVEMNGAALLNPPLHLFIQSFHTDLLEAFFIICTQLTSTLTLCCLYVTCCFWFFYRKNKSAIYYLTSLIISSSLIGIVLSNLINTARPKGFLVTMTGSSFLPINLMVATAFYGFILLYIKSQYTLLTNTLRTFILVLLGLSGLGTLYLGDFWFTDVLAAFLCGAFIGLLHWLMYRRINCPLVKTNYSSTMIWSLVGIILLASAISTHFNFKTLVHNHTPFQKEYLLSADQWWNQNKSNLPIYRFNRIGKRISLLNIQYSGELVLLRDNLAQSGWVQHNESLFTNFLMHMSNNINGVKLPLLAQLFENKKPELIMTYNDIPSQVTFELRIWESSYYLTGSDRPLWIGSVHQTKVVGTNNDKALAARLYTPLTYVLSSLDHFSVRRISLQGSQRKSTALPAAPYILLIKEQE